jgi:hypothetical protein
VAVSRPRPQTPTAVHHVWVYDFVFDTCADVAAILGWLAIRFFAVAGHIRSWMKIVAVILMILGAVGLVWPKAAAIVTSSSAAAPRSVKAAVKRFRHRFSCRQLVLLPASLYVRVPSTPETNTRISRAAPEEGANEFCLGT